VRLLMGAGGLCFAVPGGGELGLDQAQLFGFGLAMALPALLYALFGSRSRSPGTATG